ncbi:MAG: putative nuclease [Ilumatobacteraceae bacterium]|nr:putative nuclease [Ilumatobacteraceae bacterium]
MPRRRTVSLLIASVALLAGCGGDTASTASTTTVAPPASTYVPNATIVRVVDGDTVDATVSGTDERVRLIGIDTPETKKPNTPVQCYGPEASAYTESLLPPGTAVYLERDLVGRDDYGRLLAYVFRTSDGLFVNADIIDHGFARVLEIKPNLAYHVTFEQGAEQAEAMNLGLWAHCGG